MRRLGVVLLIAALLPAGVASAAGADGGNTSGDVDDDGTVTAAAQVNGVVYTVGGGSGPRCSWRRLTQGEYEDLVGDPFDPSTVPGLVDVPEPVDPDEPTEEEQQAIEEAEERNRAAVETEQRRRATPSSLPLRQGSGIAAHGAYAVSCPTSGFSLRYVDLTITATDLAPGAYDRQTEQILPPVPNTSPALDIRGIVNLGMWLAVEPATVPPVTAEAQSGAGLAWITITPTHDGISFDFGNGDSVACDGWGDPIEESYPDGEVQEESPVCGYTYRQSSPDDDPYEVTVSTTWNLPYESSSGSGALDPFTRTLTTTHDVNELQTLGTGG